MHRMVEPWYQKMVATRLPGGAELLEAPYRLVSRVGEAVEHAVLMTEYQGLEALRKDTLSGSFDGGAQV